MGAALVGDRPERPDVARGGPRRRAADGAAELEARLVGEAEDLGDVGPGPGGAGLGGGEGDAVDAKGLLLFLFFFFGGEEFFFFLSFFEFFSRFVVAEFEKQKKTRCDFFPPRFVFFALLFSSLPFFSPHDCSWGQDHPRAQEGRPRGRRLLTWR